MPRPIVNIAGQVFGRLTAIERAGSDRSGFAAWRCQCECGAVVVVSGHHLRRGGTRSCGCLARDISREMAAGLAARTLVTHDCSYTSEYLCWSKMLANCFNRRATNFKFYGARGVSVDPTWCGKGGFQNFLRDMGRKPDRPGLALRRIDPEKSFSPGNCRWGRRGRGPVPEPPQPG